MLQTIIKKNMKIRVLVNSPRDLSRLSTIFFIFGTLLIVLKGLRTLNVLKPFTDGKLAAPEYVKIKSKRLINTIKKSKKFQESLKNEFLWLMSP